MTVLTPIWSLPSPNLTDPPNGPAQFQALANATETALTTVNTTANSLRLVSNNQLNADSSPATASVGVETQQWQVSFVSLGPSRQYQFVLNAGFFSAGSAVNYYTVLRWRTTGTVVAADPAIIVKSGSTRGAGILENLHVEGVGTGFPAGTIQVGVGIVSTNTTGARMSGNSLDTRTFRIYDLGQ